MSIVAYNLYCLHHVPAVRQPQMRSRAICATITIVALIITLAVRANLILAVIFGAMCWISGVILFNHIFFLDYSIKKIVQKQIAKGRYTKAMGHQSLVMTPDTYVHTSPFAEVKRSWQTAEGIRITDNYAFIFVEKNCAEIIPRRAFPDTETWQNFIETLQHYYTEAIKRIS